MIRLIKTTKVPIICICNDRLSQKVRTLASHCFDLKLRRPTKEQISRRMRAIAKYEGLPIDNDAIELLSESSGNDIRQVLHAMEMLKRSAKAKVSAQEIGAKMKNIQKDAVLRTTPTEAAVNIMMEPRLCVHSTTDIVVLLYTCILFMRLEKHNLNERTDFWFLDYSMIPLYIQQLYITSVDNGHKGSPRLVNILNEAADSVSDSDLGKLCFFSVY